ncbi:hypothetical protein EDD18DRAFT_1281518 [Armillaria luteobubalina]|uniref:Heterokaryon incompatibility domain-containing protein n=1 Tax=Armillaria luteobubalina TaxID=153913 RepID=A0AA39QD40_9AGAR|nr:hypothetical protein EDD18DRAFT_1281518 [Armillaria luteobubalina]
MLEVLNILLGTSYTLNESIISLLNSYVTQNLDFGTAYAHLRQHWHDVATIEEKLRHREVEDLEMRRNVLADGRITKRNVPPRRVWDLYANRVVPYWVTCDEPWAISHAWVDEKDRVNVMTSINGREWPVPLPKDANLDLIRIEMLNLTSHGYVWLDVLCLRQESETNDDLRFDEWELDVPTIGSVYERAYSCVVYYFNGLGRPLHLKPDYFKSDRCWFRRAWTLQEITAYPAIIGGETGKDDMDKHIQRRFNKRLSSLQRMRRSASILEFVFEMKHRVSTKPLDKVAGLAYLLQTNSIPIYDTKRSPADAWEVLVDVMHPSFQAVLLFVYPEPGNRSSYWRPSWDQVMTNKALAPRTTGYLGRVDWKEYLDADYYRGYIIESGNVRGLGEVPKRLKPRHGEVVFKDANGATRTLKVIADHLYPIPNGFYTLLGCYGMHSNPDRWVVGQRRPNGMFEKWSVIRLADDENADLNDLALDRQVETLLC